MVGAGPKHPSFRQQNQSNQKEGIHNGKEAERETPNCRNLPSM